jgi:hypothetical protein
VSVWKPPYTQELLTGSLATRIRGGIHWRHGFSSSAGWLLASQDGLCSVITVFMYVFHMRYLVNRRKHFNYFNEWLKRDKMSPPSVYCLIDIWAGL